MIKIKNLCLNISGNKVLDNINAEIPDNKITVLIGPNGAGKTTLLKVMAGIIKPDSGKIESDFKSLFYLPQKISYPRGITLFEYIESSFYKDNWKWFLSAAEKQKIQDVIDLTGLNDKKNINIDNLSSGELQKANIALALVSGADILLLDEPTSNADLKNQIKILDILKSLKEQKLMTVMLVMHDINIAASYGEYFIALTENKEVIAGDKKIFLTEKNLEKIFGLKFKVTDNENSFNIQINNY